MQIIRKLACPRCDGKKFIKGDECPHCKGGGKVLARPKGEAEHNHKPTRSLSPSALKNL